MSNKIFISYRRDDVPGDARGVRDAIAAKFGRDSVFMDVDNLLAGQRFDRELAKALDACDVLLAIIGSRWWELFKSRVDAGERDFVREEIATALQRGIVVIPVRVGREGQMPPLPRLDALPEDLRDLVHHQKHDLTHERFARDTADLVAAIKAMGRTAAGPTVRRKVGITPIAVGVAFLALAGSAGAYYIGAQVWSPLGSSLAMPAVEIEARRIADSAEARKTDDVVIAKLNPSLKNEEAKFKMIKEVARNDDPLLNWVLGYRYAEGRGVEKNEIEAERHFRYSAELGYASAQYALANYYALGRGGLSKSDVEAVRLYKLAANQKNAAAQHALADFHASGRAGVPKSDREAARLKRLAADGGYQPAKAAIARLQQQ